MKKKPINISTFTESIYNVDTERVLTTDYNFDLTIEEVQKLENSAGSITVERLITTIRRCLKNALFGCFIDIGLCSDSSGKLVEFYGDNNYVRKLYKGESGCFKSMEQRKVVVEVDHASNMVVFVPLLGPTIPYGVLEIHGLLSTEVSNPLQFKRSPEALRNMITLQDYSFIPKTRFWKKGSLKFYGGIPQKGQSNITVSGRIKNVVYTKNGVPFYGGPRFNMTWEDGKEDIELTANEIISIFQETSHSLGNSTLLDNQLQQRLQNVGNRIGKFLEVRKAEMFIKQLSSKIKQLQLNIVGIIEMALQSFPTILVGVREISLAGYKFQSSEVKLLVNYSFQKESMHRLPSHQNYSYSVQQYIQDIIAKRILSPGGVADLHGTTWIGMELNVPESFLWNKTASYDRYFVVLHKKKVHESPLSPFDEEILRGVIREVQKKIVGIWTLDLRRRQFRELLKYIETKVFEWRNLSTAELCQNVLQTISTELLNADMYVGIVAAGGELIQYIAATENSHMVGQKLHYGEGISFDIVESLQTMCFDVEDLDKTKLLVPNAVVSVLYGKKLYSGKIMRYCGHEMFDVRYDVDKKVETGVHLKRIIPINKAFQVKFFKDSELPFMGVALRHRNKCMGVIGSDRIKTNEIIGKKIDDDVRIFLEQLGKLLGSAIDVKQKKAALQTMYVVAKNQHADTMDLFKALFHAISTSCSSVCGIVCAKLESNQNLTILHKQGSVHADLMKKVKSFDLKKFGRKPMQKIGEKSVLLLCSVTAERINQQSVAEERLFYVIGISSRYPLYEPDVEYFESLQKTTTVLLHTILSQKASNEFRHEALIAIKSLCVNFSRYQREEFFALLMEQILSSFHSTNMYVGLLGHHQSEIKYILASSQSNMRGKVLPRDHEKLVSFLAVEEDRSICVTSSSPSAAYLHHFGPKHQFEFPFIVTPIVAGIDSVIGILGADNCAGEQVVDSSGQIDDIVSFYATVGLSLGKVIREYRVEDTIEGLKAITAQSQNFAEGISRIRKLLLDYLPFVNKVYDVTFLPKFQPSMEMVDLLAKDNLYLYFCITKFDILDSSLERPKIKIIYQDACMHEFSVESNKTTQLPSYQPLKITVSSGSKYENTFVAVVLTATQNFVEVDIAQLILPIHYFLNASLLKYDHIFLNPKSSSLKKYDTNGLTNNGPGKFQIVSKLFRSEQIVGFELNSLCVFIHGAIDSSNQAELFIVIEWNKNITGKTLKLPFYGQESINWVDINHFFGTTESNSDEFGCEVWMSVGKGKEFRVAKLKLIGEELWQSLDASSSGILMDLQIESTVVIKINILGNVIKSNQINSSFALRLLDLGDSKTVLSSNLLPIKKQRSLKNLDDYIQCDVSILEIRDFTLPLALHSFVTIFLNGEEIGSTSISNEVVPSWYDETFHVLLSADNSRSKLTTLTFEINGFYDNQSKSKVIGIIKLDYIHVAELLLGNCIKVQWYDVDLHEECFTNFLENQLHEKEKVEIFTPQIKLAGKPTSVAGLVQDGTVEDKGYLEISQLCLKIYDDAPLSGSCKLSVQMQLNDKLLLSANVFKSQLNCNIIEHPIYIRYPTTKPLKSCELVVKVHHENLNSSQGCDSSIVLTGDDLISLLGQRGLVSSWYILPAADKNLSATVKINIKGGPKNSRELFKYDNVQFSLDLLAFKTTLVKHPTYLNDKDNRLSLSFKVFWNNCLIGWTFERSQSSNMMFESERYILKVPLIEEADDRVSYCSLKIEMFHTTHSIGAFEILGKNLSEFFATRLAIPAWVDVVTRDSEDIGKMKILVNKFPLEIPGALNTLDVGETSRQDILIEILEANKLSNTDAFGGANAYVEIWYNNTELGCTQIIKNSLDLQFKSERFIFSYNRSNNDTVLKFHVWSLFPSKPRVFLGEVKLKHNRFEYVCNQSSPIVSEIDLSTNEEFTEEENKYVKGSLKFSMQRILYQSFIHQPQFTKESILYINGCRNFPQLDFLSPEPTSYLKVFRRYQREGNSIEQILITEMVTSSNPTYSPKFCLIAVPVSDDWSGFGVVIELCNQAEQVLFILELIDTVAKSLLCREGEVTADHIEFNLMPVLNTACENPGPKLLLSGGIRTDFELAHSKGALTKTVSHNNGNRCSKFLHLLKLEFSKSSVVKGAVSILINEVEASSFQISLQDGRGEVIEGKTITPLSLWLNAEDGVKGFRLQLVFRTEGKSEIYKSTITSVEEVYLAIDSKLNISLKLSSGPVRKVDFIISDVGESSTVMDSLFTVINEDTQSSVIENFRLTLESLNSLQGKHTKANDIYVLIKFNQKTEQSFKTQFYKFMSNIDLDCEVFNFAVDKGSPISEFSAMIMLKNQFKGDTVLHEISFHQNSQLLENIFSSKPFDGSVIFGTKIPSQSLPTMKISCCMIPNYFNSVIFNSSIPLPKTLTELELTIVAVSDLAKLRFIGSTDCYAAITYNFQEVGKTSTVVDTIHPVWKDNQTFKIRIPFKFDKNIAENIGDKKLLKEILRSDFSKDGVSSIDDLKLTIDLIDDNRTGKPTFLGCVVIKLSEIADTIFSDKLFLRKWLPIVKSNTRKKAEQKSVQGKLCVVLNKVCNLITNQELQLNIRNCRLSNSLSGSLSVKIRLNGKYIGCSKATASGDTLSLDCDSFTVKIPKSDICINIELWQPKNNDKEVCIGGCEISRTLQSTTNEFIVLNFTSLGYLPDTIQLNKVSGSIELQFKYEDRMDAKGEVKSSVKHFELNVMTAKKLSKNNFNTIDPYAVCKWNQNEVIRTNHVSKCTDPAWKDAKCHISLDSSSFELNKCSLIFEVWNHRHVLKDDMIGKVELCGDELRNLLDPTAEANKYRFALQSLTKVPNIVGYIEICVECIESLDENHTKLDDLDLHWLELIESSMNIPSFSISIHDCEFIFSKITDSKNDVSKSLKKIAPSCTVKWMEKDVGYLAPIELQTRSILWPENMFLLQLPENLVKMKNGILLTIEVWDGNPKDKVLIGNLSLDLNHLARLYHGKFIFPLNPCTDAENRFEFLWKSQIHFRIQSFFPFWDTIHPIPVSTYRRSITVVSAANLPSVNGEVPDTKCAVIVNGVNFAVSPIISNNANPYYPHLSADLVIDFSESIHIVIEITYVSSKNKKEIVLGKEEIPVEFLLRPPPESFDLFLGPTGKRNPEYQFALSGSVRVKIVGSNRLDDAHLHSLSHNRLASSSDSSTNFLSRIMIKDNLYKQYKELSVDKGNLLTSKDGETLSDQIKTYFGSVTNLALPQELTISPSWLLIPVSDIGISIGSKKRNVLGSPPGSKFVFAMERPNNRTAISDSALLQDISFYISECMVKLRWKDINRKLRDNATALLENTVNELHSQSEFNIDKLLIVLNLCFSRCIPNVVVRIAFASSDFGSISYEVFNEKSDERVKFCVPASYGSDIFLFGRCFKRSNIVQNFDDLEKRNPLLFYPFIDQHFPRINAVIGTEDVSVGLIQIENFLLYQGGTLSPISEGEASEIQLWVEYIGSLMGGLICKHSEQQSLMNIMNYTKLWDFSLDELHRVILLEVQSVLQGCKLAEIISIDSEYKLISELERKPEASKVNGRRLTIRSCRVSVKKEAAKNIQSKGFATAIGSKVKSILGGNKLSRKDGEIKFQPEDSKQGTPSVIGKEMEVEENTQNIGEKDSNHKDGSTITLSPHFVLGVKYDGLEQIFPLFKRDGDAYFMSKDIVLYMKSSQNAILSMYEVDGNLIPISEFSGLLHLTHSSESNSTLSPATRVAGSSQSSVYEATYQWEWDNSIKNEEFNDSRIQGFKIQIANSRGLKQIKKNMPSAFCEVYFGKKHIGNTKVIKATSSPAWNEYFYVSMDDKIANSNLIIDVFDMSFMRKGNFLGRVEIPFDQLSLSVGDLLEYKLQMRSDVNSKKQSSVGGILTLSCFPDLKETTGPSKNISGSHQRGSVNHTSNESIINLIKPMNNPHLKLTVESAKGLASANRFGGGSDPFALIFGSLQNEGGKEKPLGRTKILEDTTNPVWEECFIVPLRKMIDTKIDKYIVHGNHYVHDEGVQLKQKQLISTIDELSSFRLEVYDHNKITASIFLGQCELTPEIYLLKSQESIALASSKVIQNNLYVKGNIQLRWEIIDQAIIEDGEGDEANGGETLDSSGIESFNLYYEKHFYFQSLTFRTYLQLSFFKCIDMNKVNHPRQNLAQMDLYIIIKFQNNSIGRTSIFTNNQSQISLQETFILPIHWNRNINSISSISRIQKDCICLKTQEWDKDSIVIELWCQDYFHQDECLGNIQLPIVELLTPLSAPINKNFENSSPISMVDSTPVVTASSKKGGGGFLSRMLQPTSTTSPANKETNVHDAIVSIQWSILKKFPTIHLLPNSDYKLHHKYKSDPDDNEKKDRVSMLMICDPTLESSRQKLEKTALPEIIKKTQNQLEKYETTPFERIGFISELHYGQLCAAARRGEKTILKSKSADSICLPLFRKSSLSQLKAVLPSSELQALACSYMVFRYPSGKMPRRDQKFVEKLQQTLVQYVETCYLSRLQRHKTLESLLEHMLVLSKLSTNNTPDEIIIQSILDMELSINCPTKLYLLQENGVDILPVAIENENLKVQSAGHIQYDIVQCLSRYCRYGVCIQFYQQRYSIIRLAWESYHPGQLCSWEDLESDMDYLEYSGSSKHLFDGISENFPDGMLAVPLFANQEIFLGLIIIKNINSIPNVSYDFELCRKDTSSDENEKSIVTVQTIEHKLTQLILKTAQYFGDAICTSRLDNVYKSIRTYPIRETTSPITYIKYIFRKVIQALPAIRQISLWAILSNEEDEAAKVVAPVIPLPQSISELDVDDSSSESSSQVALQNNLPSLISIFFGFRTKVEPPKKDQRKLKLSKAKSVIEVQPQPVTVIPKPLPVICGCFGQEDPNLLLATPVERIGNTKDTISNRRQGKSAAEIENEITALEKAKWTIGYPKLLSKFENNVETIDHASSSFVRTEALRQIENVTVPTFTNSIGVTLSRIGLHEDSQKVLSRQVFHHIKKKEIDSNDTKSNSTVKRPPLPPGPPPAYATKSVRAADKPQILKGHSNISLDSSTTGTAAQPVGSINSIRSYSSPESSNGKYHYFLAVNTHGVGGETGWGAIGEPIEKALNTVCALLDGHLNKIWNIQQKSGQHDNEEWDDDNSVISELSSNVG